MAVKWWLDGRDDLHWWQHRHPDSRVRMIGAVLMMVGAALIGSGLIELIKG